MLILGRQLFWVFVAATGALVGIDLVAPAFPDQADWFALALGLGGAVVGAVLAILWQWLAVGIVGFLAGGYVGMNVLAAFGGGPGPVGGLPLILGGVLGAMIMIVTFDWAVILLSSLTGAMLVMQALGPDGTNSFFVFAGLASVGVLIQAALWKHVGS